MAGVGDVTSMTGAIQSQVSDAAKPSQTQSASTLKESTGALNQAAQATSPNASAPPGTPPPASSAASSTAGANADPNAPRPAGA